MNTKKKKKLTEGTIIKLDEARDLYSDRRTLDEVRKELRWIGVKKYTTLVVLAIIIFLIIILIFL